MAYINFSLYRKTWLLIGYRESAWLSNATVLKPCCTDVVGQVKEDGGLAISRILVSGGGAADVPPIKSKKPHLQRKPHQYTIYVWASF